MSDGIQKNPSQTLVHDGFFSSYSVFGKFSVKTGRLCGAFLFLVELCENHLALTAVSRFVKKGCCVLARLCARMWFAYAHSAYIASFVVSDRQIAKPTCLHQQKTHFCLVTKVRFLNDVCLQQMMMATPNDVRFANDVRLTAHCGKHRIIATGGSNIIFAKQMHHIAAGDASFEDIQGFALIYLQKCGIINTESR